MSVGAGENYYQFDEEFRNSIGTVDAQGKRVWVYAKKPHGAFHNKRVVVSIALLALFFIGPFLTWHDRPFLLLNIFERKFILFGHVFWPQDFFLLAITAITFFVLSFCLQLRLAGSGVAGLARKHFLWRWYSVK